MEVGLLSFMIFMSYSPLVLILLFGLYLLYIVFYLIFCLNSFFYSYLMFLLFVTGLFVMFMYLCSVVFNEKFKIGSGSWGGFLVVVYCLFVDLSIIGPTKSLGATQLYYEFYNLFKFFLFSYNFFSLFFVCYLFFCLMIIYELIKNNKGPLRSACY